MTGDRTGATLPRVQLVLAAVLFSTGGAAIKATSLTAMQVASLRSGIAALTLLALLPTARRGFSRRSFVVGAAYAATMILFVIANKWTTAASAIFLQATAPLYIMLLAPRLLDEPVRRRDVAFVFVMAAGMALFFLGSHVPAATAPRPVPGLLAAGLSGLTWALTIMGLRSASRHDSGPHRDPLATAVLVGNAIASTACFPFALPLPSFALQDVVLIVYLGVAQIGLAYVLLTAGIRHVGALAASLLLLAEPALSPVWAWAFHGEVPGPLSLAGGAIILGATVARTILDAAAQPVTRGRGAVMSARGVEDIDPHARALWARTRLKVHPERCMLVSVPRDAAPDVIAEAAALAARGPFSALVFAPDEISLTVPEGTWRGSSLRAAAPAASGPWSVITLDLAIDLDVTGYLAPAAALLAAAGIPIVPQCAYRKDYLLVRASDRDRAVAVLETLIADCAR